MSQFNPLDKENLATSVREALLKQPVLPMPPETFKGVGIYALYYTGTFPQYRRIAEQNREGHFSCPIYVGKAVPSGSRTGGIVKDVQDSRALSARLRHHSESIKAAQNLRIEDFFFRFLIVDDIWIPLGETYMIETFQPVWNKVVAGFGIKTPGQRRKGQYTSIWDTIHPGRSFVVKLVLPPNPKPPAQILKEIESYLEMPHEQQAQVPAKVDSDEPEE